MADIITLTPQPVYVTAPTRQPIFLSLDISAYDSLDIELVCAVGGSASNAIVDLVTGMQVHTEDGWIVPSSNFAPISGSGQQISRLTVTSGLLQFLRWDVSTLGGAASLTFFIRGIARARIGGGTVVGVAAAYYGGAAPADQTLLIQSTNGGPLLIQAHDPSTGTLFQIADSSGNAIAKFADADPITFLTEALPSGNADSYVFDSINDMTASGDFFHVRFKNAGHKWMSLSGVAGSAYIVYADPATGVTVGEDLWNSSSPFHNAISFGADGASTHHNFDTNNAITTSGARLLSASNASSERFAALQDGSIVLTGSGNAAQIKRSAVGEQHQLVTKTGNYTITLSDYYIGVDTTSVAVTITLPAPATATAGATYVIYDWKNTFATNNLTIARSSTEKIDNTAANKVVSTSGSRVLIWTDGTDWFTK